MVIDFHTHTFPDELAERAVGTLAESARIRNYLNGTAEDLRRSMKAAGVDYSVLLPVVTKPEQQAAINQIAIELNHNSKETGLLSFGGIHPDNADYRRILHGLAVNGVKGIKLHPVFQQTFLDDIRYLRIISCACSQGLIVLIHAGYDISHPHWEYSAVPHIVSMLDTVRPEKLVLAHMGGWNSWPEAESQLAGRDIWLDTSFSLLPLQHDPGTLCTSGSCPGKNRNAPLKACSQAVSNPINKPVLKSHKTICETGNVPAIPIDMDNPGTKYRLPREDFLRMVKKHGADRILFGSDSPWGGQAETIAALKDTGLTDNELQAVLGENAARLLQFHFN